MNYLPVSLALFGGLALAQAQPPPELPSSTGPVMVTPAARDAMLLVQPPVEVDTRKVGAPPAVPAIHPRSPVVKGIDPSGLWTARPEYDNGGP
jgi:hypothetical protein